MKSPTCILPTLLLISILTGCSSKKSTEIQDSAPKKHVDLQHLEPIVPKYEPKSRIGNPKNYKVFGKSYDVLKSSENFSQTGIASWYGTKFHGRKTSNGDTYDMYQYTAAHKSLPLPTYVEVTNLENNKSLIVRVNDRGPFHDNRIIDLSYAAASKLGVLAKGTAKVFIKAINFRGNNNKYEYKKDEFIDDIQIIQAGAFGSKENALRFKNTIKDILNLEKINHNQITVKNIDNLYKIHIENMSDNFNKIKNVLAQNEVNYSVLTK